MDPVAPICSIGSLLYKNNINANSVIFSYTYMWVRAVSIIPQTLNSNNLRYKLTNSIAYGTWRFYAAFLRVLR